MLTLFGTLDSGNVYKAQLILARVGADYRRVDVAQTRNEPRDPRFLAVNPMGMVPAVLREDGRLISESGHNWLAVEGCTIADFALYPYTHTAGSVGFDVSRFPGIERWLERVESQPRFVPFGYEGAAETLSFTEYFGNESEE